MPSPASLVEKLAEAQRAFLRAADSIPSYQWTLRPRVTAWSAAEVVAHLLMVERKVVADASHIIQKEPRRVPLLKRAHFPFWLVESRFIRRNSPIPLDPQLVGEKEEMMGQLRATRERSLDFLGKTGNRDLSCYRWRHPFLGMLDTYEWFEMIAAHQLRHTKQMREIGRRLPKVIGISQK